MIIPKDFTLIFSHQIQLTSDVHSFYFKREDFEFTAGQYIKMMLPVEDPRGKSRTFSVCSSPFEKEYVMITSKVSQSPFKQALHSLSTGSEVAFFGSAGRMILNEEDPSPCILLAGGIGITPFRSMLLYAEERKLSIPITFFVSFSTTEEMLFYDELSKIPKSNSNIKIVYTITHSENPGSDWKGETGRISKEMIEKYAQNISSSKVYIAGPPKMVESMIAVAQELGIPPEKTLKENFVGY